MKRICRSCIDDPVLWDLIEPDESDEVCSYGHDIPKSSPMDDVADVVHQSYTRYHRPGEYDFDFLQQGQSPDEILAEMLWADHDLISDLLDHLRSLDDWNVRDGADPMYASDWNYTFIEPGPSEHIETWAEFSERVRHGQRFFDPSSAVRLSQLLGSSASTISPDLTVVTAHAGEQGFFRGRLARTPEQATTFVGNPRRELSPPPSDIAGAGRMNPPGISFFYGAYDEETCINELRPPVGTLVVTGGFDVATDLRLLDLTALSGHRPPSGLSYFADDFLERLANRHFLRDFEEIISRPIKPHESAIESVPTQMVAEYVRNTLKLDGIIYASAQSTSNAPNVVIFTEAPEQATEEREPQPLQLRADSLKVWEVEGVDYTVHERLDLDFSDLIQTINALGKDTSDWNRNQVAFIVALTDFTLDHDDRFRQLFGLVRQQQELAVRLQFRADQAHDEELQALLVPVIENYRQRLQSLKEVVSAAINYDDKAVQTAFETYGSIADTVRPLMQDLFNHSRLTLILSGSGVNATDLVKAFVGV